jgi:hypothetical protein
MISREKTRRRSQFHAVSETLHLPPQTPGSKLSSLTPRVRMAIATPYRPGILLFSVIMLFLISGCASNSKYISAPSAPSSELGISAKEAAISATVDNIIITNGEGAWVKGAMWDEYVLTIRNLSNKPLTIEKVRLVDPRGVYIRSGVNPAKLEKLSEVMAEEYKDLGIMVAIGAGPTVVASAALAAGSLGTAMGAAALMPVAVIAAPVYYFSKKHSDQKDREAIEREFSRRNLAHPVTLSGNATIQGSVFFPITPSPKALVVDCRMGSRMKVLKVSLKKLEGLHVAHNVGQE